jgi:hypothetical protein
VANTTFPTIASPLHCSRRNGPCASRRAIHSRCRRRHLFLVQTRSRVSQRSCISLLLSLHRSSRGTRKRNKKRMQQSSLIIYYLSEPNCPDRSTHESDCPHNFPYQDLPFLLTSRRIQSRSIGEAHEFVECLDKNSLLPLPSICPNNFFGGCFTVVNT